MAKVSNYFVPPAPPLHSPCSQEERFGLFGGGPNRGSSSASAAAAAAVGSAQSQLSLTRQVLGTVVELVVQLCGGDGGAVVVGMMSQALPAGGWRGGGVIIIPYDAWP